MTNLIELMQLKKDDVIEQEQLLFLYDNALMVELRNKVQNESAEIAFQIGYIASNISTSLLTSKQYTSSLHELVTPFYREELKSHYLSLSKIYTLRETDNLIEISTFIISLQNLAYEKILENINNNDTYIHIKDDTPDYLVTEKLKQFKNIIFSTRN
jgi:hypothetical protein